MLKSKRSRFTASGAFFAAGLAALTAFSSAPSQAQGEGDCVEGGAGPFCAAVEITIHCPDGEGGTYPCGHDVIYLFYERYGPA